MAPGQSEFADAASQLGDRGRRIVERQGAERGEVRGSLAGDLREIVVGHPRQLERPRWRLDVSAWRRQRDDLPVDADAVQLGLAKVDVAVAAHGDVVVAGIMEQRVALTVSRDPHGTRSFADGIHV
jgi:hypothetical protein